MSRGLSKQQRAILALAVVVNRRLSGGTACCRTGPAEAPGGRWRIPAIYAPGYLDMTAPLAAAFVYGVPFVTHLPRRCGHGERQCTGRFEGTPENKSLYNSASRAVENLRARGLLVYRPSSRRWPGDHPYFASVPKPDLWTYTNGKQTWCGSAAEGYVLTEAGFTAAADLNPQVDVAELDVALFRCGITQEGDIAREQAAREVDWRDRLKPLVVGTTLRGSLGLSVGRTQNGDLPTLTMHSGLNVGTSLARDLSAPKRLPDLSVGSFPYGDLPTLTLEPESVTLGPPA